ncbi:MAG: alcohol dehydrogenase catalytic domain-containing protein [Phycisphaerae bacterium]|nr:alcohol dehydrogenase catalytic domain-containing protein [Phycisphaerae bacterium]
MNALLYLSEGKLEYKKIPVSDTPEADSIRLKVAYCGLCGTDMHIYRGQMDSRVTTPHVLGHEASGVVEAVGRNVNEISVGRRGVVMPLRPCGECPACEDGLSHICHRLKFIGIETPGALQEYWDVPAYSFLPIPETLSLKHAALIEPLAVACHDVRLGDVRAGQNVVVLGAGPIGLLIAMVAKHKGANVILSEISESRVQLAKKLGFDVVNPRTTDLIPYVNDKTNQVGADVVFEVTAHSSGAEVMTALPRCRGRIVVVGIFAEPVKVDLKRFFRRELQLCGARVYEREDFTQAIRLADAFPLDALITDVFDLPQAPEAFAYLAGANRAMKVLIRRDETIKE